ncbi:hypothetical protein [Nonomuraea coxensis]|nr:hypothetical protein [Nonomuraea coxensis]
MTASAGDGPEELGFAVPNETLPARDVEARESRIDERFQATGCRKVSSDRR